MKKTQLGRNMVEMLGVLAIIGILSIATVGVFQSAMTRYRTNNLIEDVRLAGFVVMDGFFHSLPDDDVGMSMTGKFVQQTPYVFTAFAEKENTFEILVKDVSYNVCEETKRRKVEWLEEIKANGISDACHENDNNEMSFFFNTDLNGNTDSDNQECRTNKDCPASKPYCRYGYCSRCETGIAYGNTECRDCPSWAIYSGVSTKACHMCGNDYFSNGGGCFVCDVNYKNAEYATQEECKRCPNRCWDAQQSRCLHSTDPLFNQNGVCNWACQEGMYASSNVSGAGDYKCLKCPGIKGYNHQRLTTAGICHTCGEGYFYINAKWCVGCQFNSYLAEASSKEECDLCSNRYFNETDQKCYICPAGKKAAPDGLSCVDA